MLCLMLAGSIIETPHPSALARQAVHGRGVVILVVGIAFKPRSEPLDVGDERQPALVGLVGRAVEEPGVFGHGRAVESVVGLKKWTACQSLDRRPPSRLRSGPTRRVPNITGRWSSFWYSSVLETGPHRRSSLDTGRTNWLWQCQQPSPT